MKTRGEKRDCERWSCTAPIVFSYFNKNNCFDAQTLNHCMGGMCFRSIFSLRPKTTLYIRTKQLHSQDTYSDARNGLRTSTLAEVRWYEEILDSDPFSYKVGVEYFPPIY